MVASVGYACALAGYAALGSDDGGSTAQGGDLGLEAELGEEWVQAPQLVEWHLDSGDTWRSKT